MRLSNDELRFTKAKKSRAPGLFCLPKPKPMRRITLLSHLNGTVNP